MPEAKIIAQQVQETKTTFGRLLPDDKEMPDLDFPIPDEAIVLLLGSGIAWNTEFPSIVIQQDEEVMLEIGLDEEGAWISGIFCDENGDAMCVIEKNDFDTNERSRLWKFNLSDDQHSLTLIHQSGRKVLHVEYVNNRLFKILGDFFFRKGKRLILAEDKVVINGMIIEKMILGNNKGADIKID